MSNAMKVSESKYAQMVKEVRAIYTKWGSVLFHSADDFRFNPYHGSKDGKIIFFFYDFGLSEIKTPDGEIVPLGSRIIGDGEDKAFEEIKEKFGLVFVNAPKGSTGEKLENYEVTKGFE